MFAKSAVLLISAGVLCAAALLHELFPALLLYGYLLLAAYVIVDTLTA